MPATEGAVSQIVVRDWRELNRALGKADKDLRKRWRAAQRSIAEPVARDAEAYALSKIRHMPASPAWAQTRIGVTQKVVYVVPRERGRASRRNEKVRRPNLKKLLLPRAYDPALEQNAPGIEAAIEKLLDSVADDFNRVAA